MRTLMKTKLLASMLGLALLALFSGCTSVVKFAPYPTADAWSGDVKTLGTVEADSGKWPLSLHAQPSEYTYYSALRAKAAKTYSVPESEIVLGEVEVKIGAELDGTIRDWKASAQAGQKKAGAAIAAKSSADALMDLKKLLDAGAINQAEYDAKKKALLEKL